MRILAVVPARGGSKGIPRKNLVPLAGKPLLQWTLDPALACDEIGRVVVSTDDDGIAQVSSALGAGVVRRPAELAADSAPTRPVLVHAWEACRAEGYEADVVMTLQPTSPLRELRHLREAIQLFARYPEADSLVSVQEVPHQFTPPALMNREGDWGAAASAGQPLRRQDKPRYWARNGAALYLTRAERLVDYVWGGRVLLYEMDKLASIDIDDRADLVIAEGVLAWRGATAVHPSRERP